MPKWYMTLLLEPTNKTGPPPNKPYQSPHPPLRERKGGKRAEPELHLEERGALGVLGNACQDRAHTPPTFELRGRQAGRPAPEPRGADTSLLPDIPLFFVGLLHGNQTKLGTTSHRNTLVRRGSQLGTSRNPAASMGHSDQGKARAPLHTRRARWGRRCRDQGSVHTQMQAMQSRPDGRNRHGQNVKEGLMHIPTKG